MTRPKSERQSFGALLGRAFHIKLSLSKSMLFGTNKLPRVGRWKDDEVSLYDREVRILREHASIQIKNLRHCRTFKTPITEVNITATIYCIIPGEVIALGIPAVQISE